MEEGRKIHTIIISSVDRDKRIIRNPTPGGSFFSFEQAHKMFVRLIKEEKAKLGRRYDTKERSNTVWYAYENGLALTCFVRIEIVTSQLMDEENADG